MGALCATKTQELGFTEETISKVITLNYGKHTYTPLEIFTYGSQYNLWEINKLFVTLGEKEFQQIMEEDRNTLFGPIEKDFRKGRYSPLYFKMAGIEIKKGKGQNKEYIAESEEKFFQNWEKRFNNFKNSKTNKKKYSEIDPQQLNKYKDTLKRFDLLIFKCLLKYVINISYDKCLENKVNLAKYLRAVESDFNYKFIDEDKKNSIFCYELSKLYPHIFLVQNQSPKLIKKLEKQAKSCFKLYYNDDQMIIINKQQFKTEEFQVIDLEKQAKRFDIEGLESNGAQSESMSNRGSILQSNKGKEIKEGEAKQGEAAENEEPVVEENPFKKIFAIASPQHLIMSINFSSNYDINQEQAQVLSQLLEAIQKDKNKRFSNKIIIAGGILNSQFPNLNGYNFYPISDQDITYYKRPLPLCLEMIDCDDSSMETEQAEAANKIITNMQIIQQYITLIDGKTTANKKSKNLEADSDESEAQEETAPIANKQFQTYEEEDDYNFHKKASETTIIPCEIHPFESYLVQVEISMTKRVQRQQSSQSNESVKNRSMGI